MTATLEPGDYAPARERQQSVPSPSAAAFAPDRIGALVQRSRQPVHVLARASDGARGLISADSDVPSGASVVGTLPAVYPEWLGDRSFCASHGVRFPYVAGEMANGIATTRMVVAMARAGMLGFFGAGGLGLRHVEQAVDELAATLGDSPNWGVNLIHSPKEPRLEAQVAELLVTRGVTCISASAFMGLTPAVVRCSATGLRAGANGEVVRRTRLFAKVSRPEVAERFMSPAPAEMLADLVRQGQLTPDEAALAAHVPVAEDVTAESDSGGHTDNRPLISLLPRIMGLRDELARRRGPGYSIRVGAAGGLGTPDAVAAAFMLGAAYVVTGSVNQVALEAGISEDAKTLLAQADIADVGMAPAADMFELGVKLQVLRRGSMFAGRAGRLYELYETYPSLAAIPADARARIERDIFRASLEEVWAETRRFWLDRDPAEVERAEADPKHQMALVFRWYLGRSSRWAIEGDATRRADYQIWCGPALGAFNHWTAGSFLADPTNRSVVQIARNLLEGAAVATRAQQARTHGVPVPTSAFRFTPQRLS